MHEDYKRDILRKRPYNISKDIENLVNNGKGFLLSRSIFYRSKSSL